ncbi:MAG: sel1 repeat family protein [Abditibacteriota bacterium]|nr:sel1 repeat family protein [Abditibacteriota bacterium]
MDETGDPDVINELGAFYYGKRMFDLALRYYELAAEKGNLYATSNLGYIWYYGRTGEKDYQKAFYYFDKASRMGDLIAAYKVADMYKNGYFVEKDYQKYKAAIEELYPKVKNPRRLNDPLPEVFSRLARIRSKEGDAEEALRLYDRARDFLARRIQNNPFFGDLNVMKWMTEDIYRLRPFDPENVMLYDLYHVLKSPAKAAFGFDGETFEAEALEENGEPAIRFGDGWFRDTDDFFRKAEIDGELLTYLYDELYDFRVTEK